jgi:hypothetical protein
MRFDLRTMRATVLACMSLAALAACSTVQSLDSTISSETTRDGSYANYSVAKSLFVIQVAAAPAPAKPPASAAQGGTPAAPAAATTSWTLKGTITAGADTKGDDAKDSSDDKPATPTDTGVCAVRTAEYSAIQTEVGGAIAQYQALSNRLALWGAGTQSAKDTAAKLATDVHRYLSLVRDDNYKTAVKMGRSIYSDITAHCPPKVTVTIQQTIVPDPARTFSLKAGDNPFYSDTLTLGMDANGFLTNGAPTSASQVGATLAAGANDIGLFQEVGAPTVVADSGPAAGPGGHHVPPKKDCLHDKDIDACVADLPKANGDDVRAIAQTIWIDFVAYVPGSLKNLPSTRLPMTLYVPIDEANTDTGALTNQTVVDRLGKYDLTVKIKCARRGGAAPDGHTEENPLIENGPKDDTGKYTGQYDGLVVSASRACVAEASQNRSKNNEGSETVALAQNYFWAQDDRYLSILPTNRGFLVQRSVAYTFANGQPTGVTDSRPSEALALVSLPGTVVGSFFSGVTSAFTNAQTVTNGKAALLNAQTAYLTALANYNAALAAQAAGGKPTPTPPTTGTIRPIPATGP